LHIQPAQLDLSFVRTERVNVEDKTSSRNPLMFFLNVLTMAIGNINDAPVRLNALMLENARVSMPVLSQHVQSHYSQEFLSQIHKILGSADFLGNPVGLFNNISSGVADIFYEPYQGLVMTDRPQELGIGIAKGATSFVKKSVFGVSDSFSKVTGSISKGLAAATLDKQFQDRRRVTRARNRPKHALYGVTAGANSFVTSVASGVGGLARKPLEGAEREGLTGFFKGVGKGVVGLATKPAIGVFDLASSTSPCLLS
jgi:vacuolar protein sorting-associated protein 13A/C